MDLKDILENKVIKNIVVLTGAGISAESGIKTFRDANGMWENHDITQVASMEGFMKDPAMVQRFYNARRKQLKDVIPNDAHNAISQLELMSSKFTLITQNVDDLHERAGTKNIFHIHGELRKIKNMNTGEVKYFEDELNELDYKLWRPDIVWFGEQVKYIEQIDNAVSACDLFLCIGTSNQVYPAAGLVQTAKYNRAICIELNLEKTELSSFYDYNIFGPATQILPNFVEKLRPLIS